MIEQRKEREVAARSDRMTVSLVGYTNAGKSTLLNVLTGSDVLTENRLFATLDTRTRRWQLPGWGPVLLSDTVGFIRDLPHHLIASFKATLEESRQADLLLHVADASNPAALDQIAVVYQVLEELGIQAKDTLLVLNKIDAIDRGELAALAEPLSACRADQRALGPGHRAIDRRGEQVAQPRVPGRRRRHPHRQRPAIGPLVQPRRSALEALHRHPRDRALPNPRAGLKALVLGRHPNPAARAGADVAEGNGHAVGKQWRRRRLI